MNSKFKNLLPISDEEEVRIQRGIAEDADNPELTDEEMRQMRPFREVFPELAREIDKEIAARGRPPLAVTKTPVTLRLDPDVLAKFKATGKGWQSRINDALKQAKVK